MSDPTEKSDFQLQTEASIDAIAFAISMAIGTLGENALRTLIENLDGVIPSYGNEVQDDAGEKTINRVNFYLKIALKKIEEKEGEYVR